MTEEFDPDGHLLLFVAGLPPAIREELCQEIVRDFGMRKDWLDAERAAMRILQPRGQFLRRRRTILIVGLIDHLIAASAVRETVDEQWFGVRSLSRPQWRVAGMKWAKLRRGALAPAAIDDFKRYRPGPK